MQMGEKLEILITGQKNLENRIMDLEKSINNNNNNNNNNCKIDPDYVNKIIKNVVQYVCIYVNLCNSHTLYFRTFLKISHEYYLMFPFIQHKTNLEK